MVTRYRVLAHKRGRCGWHFQTASTPSVPLGATDGTPYAGATSSSSCSGGSGYGDLPELSSDMDHEGAWIVDGAPIADAPAYVGQVMREPLIATSAEDEGAFDREYAGMLMLSGWAGMLASAKRGGLCLDKVSVTAWVQYWRELGARIGRVVNGTVQWEGSAAS